MPDIYAQLRLPGTELAVRADAETGHLVELVGTTVCILL